MDQNLNEIFKYLFFSIKSIDKRRYLDLSSILLEIEKLDEFNGNKISDKILNLKLLISDKIFQSIQIKKDLEKYLLKIIDLLDLIFIYFYGENIEISINLSIKLIEWYKMHLILNKVTYKNSNKLNLILTNLICTYQNFHSNFENDSFFYELDDFLYEDPIVNLIKIILYKCNINENYNNLFTENFESPSSLYEDFNRKIISGNKNLINIATNFSFDSNYSNSSLSSVKYDSNSSLSTLTLFSSKSNLPFAIEDIDF